MNMHIASSVPGELICVTSADGRSRNRQQYFQLLQSAV